MGVTPHLPAAYESELVEAYEHVRRLLALVPRPHSRGDEPAHVVDPARLSRRRAETMADEPHFLRIVEAAELIAARKLVAGEADRDLSGPYRALDGQLDRFVTVT